MGRLVKAVYAYFWDSIPQGVVAFSWRLQFVDARPIS
jgi:hypothetical protein